MEPAAKKVLQVALLVVVVALTVSGILVWRAYSTARGELSESRCDGHTTFVRSEWMDTTLATGMLAVRGCMVDDLLERHELRGKTRAEVVALIGEPQRSDVFPEYDMVYWLGPERGLIGTDSEFLLMKLDKSGRVTSVELRTG
jgi:hypothetical protein